MIEDVGGEKSLEKSMVQRKTACSQYLYITVAAGNPKALLLAKN